MARRKKAGKRNKGRRTSRPSSPPLRSLPKQAILHLQQEMDPERALALVRAFPQREQVPHSLAWYEGILLWRAGKREEAVEKFRALHTDPGAARIFQRPLPRFVQALAQGRSANGDLPAPERHVLALLHALVHGEDPTPYLQDAPLPGSTELWQILVKMLLQPTAAPIKELDRLSRSLSTSMAKAWVFYAGAVACLRENAPTETTLSYLEMAHSLGLRQAPLQDALDRLYRRLIREKVEAEDWDTLAKMASHILERSQDRIVKEDLGLALWHAGQKAAEAERWQQAYTLWRQAAQIAPRQGLFYNIAMAAEAMERWVEAAEAWREVLRRRPRSKDAEEALSDGQVAFLWRRVAENYLRQASVAPNTPYADADADRWVNEAITALRTALKYRADDPYLRLMLGRVQYMGGREQAAYNTFRSLLDLRPDKEVEIEALRYLAYLSSGPVPALGPYPEALGYWRRILELDPEDQEARYNVIVGYAEMLTSPLTWGQTRRRQKEYVAEILADLRRYLPGHFLTLLVEALYNCCLEKTAPEEAFQALRTWKAADTSVAYTDLMTAMTVAPTLLRRFNRLGDLELLRHLVDAIEAALPYPRNLLALGPFIASLEDSLDHLFFGTGSRDATASTQEHRAATFLLQHLVTTEAAADRPLQLLLAPILAITVSLPEVAEWVRERIPQVKEPTHRRVLRQLLDQVDRPNVAEILELLDAFQPRSAEEDEVLSVMRAPLERVLIHSVVMSRNIFEILEEFMGEGAIDELWDEDDEDFPIF